MTAGKPPTVDLEAVLEDLADEQELERLSKLTTEQLLEEMKKDGLDPARARADQERILAKARAERAGPAAPPAKVLSLAEARERRRTPVVPLALAAAAAVAVVVGVTKREAIEAMFTPEPTPTGTSVPQVPPTHEPTPAEKAAALRQKAFVNIAKGYYGEAQDQLDEAKALDPRGDSAEAVQDAMTTILSHKRQPEGFSKPPLGPGEHRLQKTPPKP
jgi:hypothetical protein